MNKTNSQFRVAFFVKLTLLAWFSMIGFDFFWHAGLFAPLYAQPSPFLLSPDRAFAFIPLGYLSFLILGILLLWLMIRLNLKGWKQGAVFGIQLGALAWGALSLGLLSISTASPVLLLSWFVGQTFELGIAGMVIGHGFARQGLGRLFFKILAFVIVSIVVTVILQNVSFAQASSV